VVILGSSLFREPYFRELIIDESLPGFVIVMLSKAFRRIASTDAGVPATVGGLWEPVPFVAITLTAPPLALAAFAASTCQSAYSSSLVDRRHPRSLQ
jgi:hypothetical protein